MARAKISALRSPYYSNHVGDASFVIGAEAANVINVGIQLKTTSNQDLGARGLIKAWLSRDASGDVILPGMLMPTGGFAIGTDGTILPGRAPGNVLIAKSTLIIDATNTAQFSTSSTAMYRINGGQYTKTAAIDLTFTAAHVVTALKFGAILIQVNAAGTISTKVVGTPQAYDTAALALAALPAPDADKVALGYIQIEADAGNWTANTDDLVNGSDLTAVAFVDAAEAGDNYPPVFDLLSEADGDIDINFSETLVRSPFYLNLLLPDGQVKTSGAITFAA